MIKLDHFAIFCRNFYRSTFELSQETGLGHYDAGFYPSYGAAVKIVPLGPDTFIEIEGWVDLDVIGRMNKPRHEESESDKFIRGVYHRFTAKPEAFCGWCFRTDSLEELKEIARAAGFTIDHDAVGAKNTVQPMEGTKRPGSVCAPTGPACWPLGMPNVYWNLDMTLHAARGAVLPLTAKKKPKGIAWVEVGGTAEDFENWFGGYTKAKDHPIEFNGRLPGLYAIAVDTDQGQVVIRRPWLNE